VSSNAAANADAADLLGDCDDSSADTSDIANAYVVVSMPCLTAHKTLLAIRHIASNLFHDATAICAQGMYGTDLAPSKVYRPVDPRGDARAIRLSRARTFSTGLTGLGLLGSAINRILGNGRRSTTPIPAESCAAKTPASNPLPCEMLAHLPLADARELMLQPTYHHASDSFNEPALLRNAIYQPHFDSEASPGTRQSARTKGNASRQTTVGQQHLRLF
jgi:hypothetical protein